MVTAPDRMGPSGELQRASLATLRVLSNRRQLPGETALPAAAPTAPDATTLAAWRGRVDALALRLRFSDARLHARLEPPAGAQERLFSQLEQSRVEALGAADLPGVRSNLVALHDAPLRTAAPVLVAARYHMRAPLPTDLFEAAARDWHAGLSPENVARIERMAANLHDQSAFALDALALAVALGREAAIPQALLQDVPAPGARRDHGAASTSQADAPQGGKRTEPASGGILHRISAEPRGIVIPQQSASLAGASAYHAYSSEQDVVMDAQDICAKNLRSTLQTRLHELMQEHQHGIARWAHRLQRHLQSRQMRSWQFDLEEGVLDASRLVRIVTDPLMPLSFKAEQEQDFPLTAITILIDCSGSMRGRPILMAASCAQLLGTVLERCGVRSEVLGFTTRQWRGGRTRAQWQLNGRPADPGRLTDLLHIVFKRCDTPWRRARGQFAAILDDGLLKENVDGEALLWAYERLRRRPEPRRILLVISDGAPLDDATLAANDPGYLDRHLRSVIDTIQRSPVELLAIGIGHDVGAYYARAFTVTGPENLGEAMVTQLIALLGRPRGGGPARK